MCIRDRYYYLTSRHEEYAFHMDAIMRNLPRIARAGNEFVEFAMLAFHVDYRKSLKKQVQLYTVFGKVLKKFTQEGLATNIASFTHNLPYMHRSNRDYSEIALDPKILSKIDGTFAPLLGPEWEYLRPGILACFTYEKNRLNETLCENESVMGLLTKESKADGRICVMILQHSALWQLGRRQEAVSYTHLVLIEHLIRLGEAVFRALWHLPRQRHECLAVLLHARFVHIRAFRRCGRDFGLFFHDKAEIGRAHV